MKRHELREQVFRLLFQAEFHPAQDMPRQMRLFVEDNEAIGSQKDADYIETRCQAICREIPGIDKLIDENTIGWDTGRMGKVELAVLRLAVYELRFDEDIPAGVAIDEAVGIAKLYGQENSGGFVNAILAKIVKVPAGNL
ncbi:MAG: transcription antitermination factor NusB [Lachnospiraceae bacterium]|jgi:N utilization substance protein B|nr:transcription antitermination factor NusB [uncultured Acetatifactor sp.]MCI9219587.1 transcription antitermination factor NusB [Lachnospiraceae bacterium]